MGRKLLAPRVLLLGNGLNQSFGGGSWDQLMRDMTVRDDLKDRELYLTMPLQIILRTGNQVREALKAHQSTLYGFELQPEQRELLRTILRAGYDHILTTNYSYELEAASVDRRLTTTGVARMQTSFDKAKRAEPKYMLRTYNRVLYDGCENRVWHIHGEARKPDSMILGHYYYAALLGKWKGYADTLGNSYQKMFEREELPRVRTWLDAFLLGDVDVLGFGFNIAEFDLWWLLNRKFNERAPHGSVHFYEPEKPGFDEKTELLRVFGVECRSLGFRLPEPLPETADETEKQDRKEFVNDLYMYFYRAAIAEIASHHQEGADTL